jgi:hypothetical protein
MICTFYGRTRTGFQHIHSIRVKYLMLLKSLLELFLKSFIGIERNPGNSAVPRLAKHHATMPDMSFRVRSRLNHLARCSHTVQLQPIKQTVRLVPVFVHVCALGRVLCHGGHFRHIDFDRMVGVAIVYPSPVWT